MDADTTTPAPFEPLPPAVYGTKVKDLLVGQPLTADELTALLAEPTAIGGLPTAIAGLIDKWMAQPQWRVRMFGFFQQAFQHGGCVQSRFLNRQCQFALIAFRRQRSKKGHHIRARLAFQSQVRFHSGR